MVEIHERRCHAGGTVDLITSGRPSREQGRREVFDAPPEATGVQWSLRGDEFAELIARREPGGPWYWRPPWGERPPTPSAPGRYRAGLEVVEVRRVRTGELVAVVDGGLVSVQALWWDSAEPVST